MTAQPGAAADAALAVQLESCEAHAWQDMVAAAPADFVREHSLAAGRVDGIVLTRCKTIPFTHFNCVMNAGLAGPATETQIDRVIAQYRDAGIRSFTFYAVPHTQPPQLADWLRARGFRADGGWDRIYRDGQPLAGPDAAADAGCVIEKVTPDSAREWARFIDTTYGLPTTPWLLALVDRPGWHHYLLRRHGQLAAVRTMYIHHDGGAWFGIDAPVPGLMAPTFDIDLQLCRTMVRDGLALGARYFTADIEAPSPTMDTPAYRNFATLGFRRAYFRGHWVGPSAGADGAG